MRSTETFQTQTRVKWTHQTNIDININHLSRDRKIPNLDLSDLNHF